MKALENIIKYVYDTTDSSFTFFTSSDAKSLELFNCIDDISAKLGLGYFAHPGVSFNYQRGNSISIYSPYSRQNFEYYRSDTPVYIDSILENRYTPPFSNSTSKYDTSPKLIYTLDQDGFKIVNPAVILQQP